MKRLSFVLFLGLGAALLISSCKSGDRIDIPVPKDALTVVHLNNTSLSTKLTWDEIKATSWFKDAYEKADDSLLKRLLNDPEASGMNTQADMLFFIKKQGRGGYLAFEGTLSDAAAFEAFNKKIAEGDASSSKDGDATLMNLKDKAVVAWKGTRFTYIISIPFAGINNVMNGENDMYHYPLDSLKTFALGTFSISGSQSLGDDSRFASLMKDGADFHVWVNSGEYLSGLAGQTLSMFKFNDLLKGNVSATSFSFENGKIVMNAKSYLNDELANLYKKYPPKKISADVLNRIPSEHVTAVLAMNYPPEGLKALIELTGLDGMTNGFLEKAGYSIDDFVRANKGDLILAFSDFSIKREEVTVPGYDGGEPYKYTKEQPDAKVLFATSINDKAAFDKLITTLSSQLGDAKEMAKDVTYQIDKNWFVAGNAADDISKFMSGKGHNQPFASKLAGKAGGIYVDMQALFAGAGGSIKDSVSQELFTTSKNFWQDILFTTGDFKDGAHTSYGEVTLVNKTVNSLKQLNQYIDQMATIEKKKTRINLPDEASILPEH